ncbi:hypothetical protein JZ751_015316, partial [Albula glossodonta]
GSNSSSRLSAPFLSCVHTSISSWQYAKVQFSPYLHSCLSCTSHESPEEVVSSRAGPDPLPGGVLPVLEPAQQNVPLAAMRRLRLVLVVHHPRTCGDRDPQHSVTERRTEE